jgi:hypothetical protein
MDTWIAAFALVYALADIIAVYPYPLAMAGSRLFDDDPAVIVDVSWCVQATPEYRIGLARAQRQGRRERRERSTEQKECAHELFPRTMSPAYELILISPIALRKPE